MMARPASASVRADVTCCVPRGILFLATVSRSSSAATKALDRVLLWNNFVIPQWFYGANRIARWDRFGHPDPLLKYAPGFPDIWWYDTEKAAKIGRAPQ